MDNGFDLYGKEACCRGQEIPRALVVNGKPRQMLPNLYVESGCNEQAPSLACLQKGYRK